VDANWLKWTDHSAGGRDTHSRNLYQKLALMRMTKTVQFDWSAVFESLHRIELRSVRSKFLVQVSWESVSPLLLLFADVLLYMMMMMMTMMQILYSTSFSRLHNN